MQLIITSWLMTIFALYGAYLVSDGQKNGFKIWLVTNSFFAIHNLFLGIYPQTVLFICYLIITINGIRKWN